MKSTLTLTLLACSALVACSNGNGNGTTNQQETETNPLIGGGFPTQAEQSGTIFAGSAEKGRFLIQFDAAANTYELFDNRSREKWRGSYTDAGVFTVSSCSIIDPKDGQTCSVANGTTFDFNDVVPDQGELDGDALVLLGPNDLYYYGYDSTQLSTMPTSSTATYTGDVYAKLNDGVISKGTAQTLVNFASSNISVNFDEFNEALAGHEAEFTGMFVDGNEFHALNDDENLASFVLRNSSTGEILLQGDAARVVGGFFGDFGDGLNNEVGGSVYYDGTDGKFTGAWNGVDDE